MIERNRLPMFFVGVIVVNIDRVIDMMKLIDWTISPEGMLQRVRDSIYHARRILEQVVNAECDTWESLMEPLELARHEIHQSHIAIKHLYSVSSKVPGLEAVNEEAEREVIQFESDLLQNAGLYHAVQSLANGPDLGELDFKQKRAVELLMRSFQRNGISLGVNEKSRLTDIQKRIAQCGATVRKNITAATKKGWFAHVLREDEVKGLSETLLASAKEEAEKKGLTGSVFTLEPQVYTPVMNSSASRTLRDKMYRAFTTRASGQGPDAGEWDNGPIAEEILALRREKARLLGFGNYALYAAEPRVYKDVSYILFFLRQLAMRIRPKAESELAVIVARAQKDGVEKPGHSDFGYYGQILMKETFGFNDEDIRQYFPVQQVVAGVILLFERLYGIGFVKREDVSVWNKDAAFYEIRNADGTCLGGIYLDLFARDEKTGGSWMENGRFRSVHHGEVEFPVVYLMCDFPPLVNGQSLLRHGSVVVLLHELGHALHHIFCRMEYPSIAMDALPRDARECPSQLMENLAWTKDAVDLVSGHFETGEKIPDVLFRQMLEARNFNSGMAYLFQIELALFDLRLYMEYVPGGEKSVQDFMDEVRNEVAIVTRPSWNRMQNCFLHIFEHEGDYASGYCVYLLALISAADIWGRFEETGIFNTDTWTQFREKVLAPGGSREFAESFLDFRGREPSMDAFLRHNELDKIAKTA